jgi:hypothetical protein
MDGRSIVVDLSAICGFSSAQMPPIPMMMWRAVHHLEVNVFLSSSSSSSISSSRPAPVHEMDVAE